MKAVVKKPPVAKSPPDLEILAAADAFTVQRAARSAAEKAYDKAKDKLKSYLGDDVCKTLSDGRVVSQIKRPVAAETETRGAYDKVLLSVSPKPAA